LVSALHKASVDAPGSDLDSLGGGEIGVSLAHPSVSNWDQAVVVTTNQTASGTTGTADSDWLTAIGGADVGSHASVVHAVTSATGEDAVTATASGALDLSGPAGEHFEGTSDGTSHTTASSSVAWASGGWDPGSRNDRGSVDAWELSLRDAIQPSFFLGGWAREGDAGGHGKTALHNTSVDTPGKDLAAGAIGMISSRVCLAVPSIGDRDQAVVVTTDHTATGSASSTSRDWDTAIDGTSGRGGRSNTGAMVSGA
jgi:hypothetical protein